MVAVPRSISRTDHEPARQMDGAELMWASREEKSKVLGRRFGGTESYSSFLVLTGTPRKSQICIQNCWICILLPMLYQIYSTLGIVSK
jgi:hypothetical protein